MLARRFPKVSIAEGKTDESGNLTTDALRDAFRRADFMLHGSGPAVLAQNHLETWRRETSKPYGIYGVTIDKVGETLKTLLDGAAFVYLRDTNSLDVVKKAGVTAKTIGFTADAAFAVDLRDDAKALAYRKSVGLEKDGYACFLPRLRYTPYYKINNTAPTTEDLRREKISDEFKAVDHAKMRETIIAWVRQTGRKALACPEMTYEMAVAKEFLVDPLPDDVKKNVVWRETYWTPDEAASVYAHAAAMVSFEMHSPIMAAHVGTPAMYLRQPTDTSKGQMWRDVGLFDWIFEADAIPADAADVTKRLLEIHRDPAGAKKKVDAAMRFVRETHKKMIAVLATQLGV